jgi:hypothetical protein
MMRETKVDEDEDLSQQETKYAGKPKDGKVAFISIEGGNENKLRTPSSRPQSSKGDLRAFHI